MNACRPVVLALLPVLCIILRLISSLKFEPIIQELDPHFNWRCAEFIDAHGVRAFLDWYDNMTWHPYGRSVGQTSYPGMMVTVVYMRKFLRFFHIEISLLKICVYIGPLSGAISVLLSFQLCRSVFNPDVGLIAAFVSSTVPCLIASTAAGSFDYEAVSFTILLFFFWQFLLAVKGTSRLAVWGAALSYGYLVTVWGGYVFLSNFVSCYVGLCLLFGAFDFHLWYFYCVWFVFGTLIGSSVPFVGAKILVAPENFANSAAFLFVNAFGVLRFIRANVSATSFRTIVITLLFVFPFATMAVLAKGRVIPMFTGRILQLFQPSVAYRMPEIAAVLEHQPACWSVFYLNCGPLLYLFPVGVFILFREGQFLLVLLAVVSLYFAAVMMRLVHIFMIAFVMAAAVALDKLLKSMISRRNADSVIIGVFLAIFVVLHVNHSVYFAFNGLADNHLNFQIETSAGIEWSRDHLEAYRWLFENTDPNSKVIGSWDLGYQITSLSGRSVYIDGNTNNFTHMSLIALIVASPEEAAWRVARMIGADYYVVTFGGVSAFPEDDVAKFPWFVRSIERTFPNISADKFQNKQTPFLVGPRVRKAARRSLVFRASYYRFGELRVFTNLKKGTDLARGIEVGALDFELNSFAEVYTTENWIVRIYRIAPDPIWDKVM